MVTLNWAKIRNEYINGHISYRKLAEKHGVSFNTLKEVAIREKWYEKRTTQHNKIAMKTEQKTAEKIAELESDLAANINSAANELLKKLQIAIEQTDLYIEKTKTRTPKKVRDKTTGEVYTAWQEKESIELSRKEGINLDSALKIANAIKMLQTMQTTGKDTGTQNTTPVSIVFEAATPNDRESDEE